MLWNPTRGGSSVTIVESWEGQSTGPWDSFGVDSYITSPVYDGTYAAEIHSFKDAYSESGDGLNYYPQKGDVIKLYTRYTSISGQNTAFWYGYDSTGPDYYEMDLEFGPGRLRLRRIDGGSSTNLAIDTGYTTPPNDVWIECKLVWDDGTLGGSDNDHTLTITDVTNGTQVTQLTANDSTYASNTGVGMEFGGSNLSSSNPIIHDYWHVA